jgi:hypothetical protein
MDMPDQAKLRISLEHVELVAAPILGSLLSNCFADRDEAGNVRISHDKVIEIMELSLSSACGLIIKSRTGYSAKFLNEAAGGKVTISVD